MFDIISFYRRYLDSDYGSKDKDLFWKAASGALPVGENISGRIQNINIPCPRCGAPETVAHLLFHCTLRDRYGSTLHLKLI